MQVIEKNSLFAQVSGEQSAVVSGGITEVAALTLAIFLRDGALSSIEALGVALVNLLGA
ncbi:hypothetical protein AB7310_08955 [Cylindrospermopsis raciborskii UAM/DH-BiRr]|uniref:hypothetical protein n=1 Tax=Cylindrospermopsis raciborskii TaxID=77022 RepID=UPI003879F5E0